MSTHSCTSCLPVAIATHTPWWQRVFEALTWRWQQARDSAGRQRELCALSDLSDRTLQDIGLSEQMHWRPRAYKLDDFERGRW